MVEESIYDYFKQEFLNATKSIRIGDPKDETTVLGPLARKDAPEMLSKIVASANCTILCGGNKAKINGKGYFFEATVLECDIGSEILKSGDPFGPVVCLTRLNRGMSNECIADCVNDCEYGLTAVVYTNNIARFESLRDLLDVGSVYLNTNGYTG